MLASDNSKNVERLMLGCQGLVKTLAWKMHRQLPSHVELDDLVGYGQLGLAQAAQEFDPERGGQFSTYAYHRVRGAILDGLSQMSWFSRADFAGGRYGRSKSMASLNDEGDDRPGTEVEDTGGESPDDAASRSEEISRLAERVESLPEPARLLIRAAYFEGLNLAQAGERMGYSRGWACRMHQRALSLLAESLGS